MKATEHKEYILYDSLYLKLENTHLIYSGRKQVSDGLGPGVGLRLTREGHKGMGVFCILIVVVVTLIKTY